MLGRLFSSKSNSNLSELPSFSTNNTSSHISPSNSVPSKLDLGKSDDFSDAYTRALLYGTPQPLALTLFDTNLFRIVIIQDGGIRSKNVLYDSSIHMTQGALSLCQSQSQANLKPDNSKNHNLMELSDYMFGSGVPTSEWSISTKLHSLPSLPRLSSSFLITRLFSLNSKFTVCSNPDKSDDDWLPQSSLPLTHSAPSKDSTRFGIGLVIPVQNKDLEAMITNNWEEYISFLATFQLFIILKLELQCTINPSGCLSLYKDKKNMVSKRLLFLSQVLQNDMELQFYLHSLIKLSHSLFQIPRLLVGLERSDATLFNWCHHVAGWLEFKDGKNLLTLTRLDFLASLFVVLMPLRRELLTNKPSDKTKKIVRVVFMTGNPAVVQKLIFIIMGILAKDVLSISISTINDSITPPTKSIDIAKKTPMSLSPSASSSSTTPSLVSSFSKGWEIPVLTPSIPTTTVTARPVNFSPSKSTEASSASLLYLSSSLSSSYVSSSWKQSSFFDKWRSSLATMNDQHDSIPKNVQQRRFSNFRTPSPGLEYEEFPWTNTNNMHSFQHSKSTRNQTGFDLSISAAGAISRYNASECEHIDRTFTAIKGTIDIDLEYLKECQRIMSSDPRLTVTEDKNHTRFLDTPPLSEYRLSADLQQDSKKSLDCFLKPLVGYVEEFRPEFALQGCPIKAGLDQEIINTMKNDLIDHAFMRSPVAKTVSKTILVSLAAREIKSFEVKNSRSGDTYSVSPTHLTSVNDFVNVKKIFSPRKKDLDLSKVTKVDHLLDIIIDIAKAIGAEDTSVDKDDNHNSEELLLLNDKVKFQKIRQLLDEVCSVV